MMIISMKSSRDRVRQKEWYPMPWDDMRRTVCTETIDATFHMQENFNQKKREARKRKYEEYQTFFYGTDLDKEIRKQKLRDILNSQIREKESGKEHFALNTDESRQLTAEAVKYLQEEKRRNQRKRQLCVSVRDANKLMIDFKAKQREIEKNVAISKEKDSLKYNPLNWRKSLW